MSEDTSRQSLSAAMAHEEDGHQYWAFISYHSDDTQTARRLMEELEGFRIPKTIQRQSRGLFKPGSHVRPIFCDRAELPLAAKLHERLKAALTASRFLILLYSPEAARSSWVKEEVEHFMALGREDRIIGILARGEMRDLRQFLRRRRAVVAQRMSLAQEKSASPQDGERTFADLQSKHDDWRTVLLRTLATMTGVGLEDYARRERRRTRRFKRYYSTFVTQWHLPRGVNELGRALARRQPTCYCFKWQGARLRRVEFLKGGAALLEGGFAHNAAALELLYDDEGTLTGMAFLDKVGNRVGGSQFSPDRRFATEIKAATGGPAWTGRPKSAATDFYGVTPGDWQAFMLQHGKTQAHRTHYTFSKEGFVIEERMLDLADRPHVNDMLVHGYVYELDESGIRKSVSYLGLDGGPCVTRLGVRRVDYEHAAFGEMTKETFLGEDGKPTAGDYGYAIQRIEHEYAGRTYRSVRCSYFDADDKPTVVHRGFSSFHSFTDDRGNYVEHRYFDPLGKPVCCIEGHAVSRGTYDSHGRQTEALFYGLDGLLTKDATGRVGWQAAYDEFGNQTEFKDLGPGRKGALVPLFPTTLMSYDTSRRLIERRFVGANGRPMEIRSGYAAEVLAYDETHGHLRRREFRDRRMRPVVRRNLADEIEDCAAVEYRYTGYGDLEALRLLGPDGAPRLSRWGFAEIRLDFDRRGLVEGMSFYGTQGEPVISMLGFHRSREQFDARTSVRKIEYFGCYDERVDVLKPAAAGTLQTGHLVFFPPAFNKVVITSNRAEKKGRYDFFAASGARTGPGWECAAVEFIQQSRESLECRFFNEDGNLRDAPSRSVVQFDEAERPRSIRYLDAAGEPAEDGWGICLHTAELLPGGGLRWHWFDRQGGEMICVPYVHSVANSAAPPKQLKLGDSIFRAGAWSLLTSQNWTDPAALFEEIKQAVAASLFRRKAALLAVRENEPCVLVEEGACVQAVEWGMDVIPLQVVKDIDAAAARL